MKVSVLRRIIGIVFLFYVVLILITTSETIPQARANSAAPETSSVSIEVAELQLHD